MRNYYRRNADEDGRDLERQFFEGDQTVLPQLVVYKARTGGLTIPFLIEVPQAFHYMPELYKKFFIQGGFRPPPLYPVSHSYEDHDYEEEEEEEEEIDEDLLAAQEEGSFWGCVSCGREDLWEGNRGETWDILTAASAAVTTAKLSRGDEGDAICDDCANEAGLDLDLVVQEDLEDYCASCGEMEQDCYCNCDECGEKEEECTCD